MDYEKEIQKALLHLKINPGLFLRKNYGFRNWENFLWSKSANFWLKWAIFWLKWAIFGQNRTIFNSKLGRFIH